MFRLASILYSIIGTTMAGIFFIATLVSGNDTLIPIVVAIGTGFVLALPVTYFITKSVMSEN